MYFGYLDGHDYYYFTAHISNMSKCTVGDWEHKERNEGEGTGACMVERANKRESEAGCVSSQGWGR